MNKLWLWLISFAVAFFFINTTTSKLFGAIILPHFQHQPFFQQPDSVVGGIKVFTVEQKPDFPGGPMEFYKYLAENTKYPYYAMDHQIQGTVWVQFIIDKQGNVTNVKVIKSVHPLLDEEAVRVVKSMPKWKPGLLNGKPVDVEFTVPIIFKLY